MSKYYTGDEIGSGSAKNFFDNAQNLDYWSNSTTLDSFKDRLGNSRKTLNGMQKQFVTQLTQQATTFKAQISQEDNDWRQQAQTQLLAAIAQRQAAASAITAAIQASGYQVLGNYAAGMTVTAYNQVIIANGVQYKPGPNIVLPYTLTGDSATDLKYFVSAGSGVLATDLSKPTGAGQLGTLSGGTVAQALSYFVTPEQFGAVGDGVADDTGAVQAAIDYAITHKIMAVYGGRHYATSSPVEIANVGVQGLTVRLLGLKALSTFIKPTEVDASTGLSKDVALSLWNAPALVKVGDDASNIANIELWVDYLDGGGITNGVNNYGFGYSLSHIHLGYATNCIQVIGTGNHTWPNASMRVTGHYWTGNGFGIILENGTGTNSPIVESWKIEVLFMAANRYAGVMFRKSGHYAQIRGDFDFNGQYFSILQLSAYTNLDNLVGQKNVYLTNGTTACEFMFYYTYRGSYYIVLREDKNVSAVGGAGSSYTAGQVLTTSFDSTVSLTVGAVNVCRDNASGTNYFDILMDFEGSAFAKLHFDCGYLSEIKGGAQHTCNIQYMNSFNALTNSNNGLAVGNSGSAMSFHNLAISDSPWLTTNSAFVNLDRYLYMKWRRTVGEQFLSTVTNSSSVYTNIFTLSEQSTDKIADEGTMFFVTINSNYGSMATFILRIKGTGITVTQPTDTDGAFEYRFIQAESGFTMQLRQESQASMNFLTNIVRIG
ncbi:hypothetical protein LLQ54_20175 [Rouxiella badensis]|uniref:hypothetical protein n=3 Tax=Rouxiella badensis TaxID=1646377 RepID=UPI001D1391B8|nr:hypothetical protein [Rouxiella badensis]MCC3720516.1 hypothetical protein [Rouxiella badensis]MCC3730355.1 hypothetical protein [Rouxiella badensis]MCC3742194.1 hypothetical protein [Rouxiella badensis]